MTQYKGLVIAVCFSMTKNYFDAEDLAQETFLAACRNFSRFDGKNTGAWLTTIAANKCRDYLRSAAFHNVPLSDADLELLEDRGPSPEESAERASSDSLVWRLCGKLKEPYRSVAEAYFCREKKLSELAEETGESLRTLETRLYRSKKLLRKLWKEETEHENRSKTGPPSGGADAT